MTPTLDRAAFEQDDPARLGRRNVVAGIAGIGLAGIGISRAFAQDSTPTAEETPAVGSSGDTTPATSTDTNYQIFITNLATELGSDAATVDTAIRDSLKMIVDDQFAAGHISQDLATELKTRIDESSSPIRLSGGGRVIGGGNHDGGSHKGGPDGAGAPTKPSDDTTTTETKDATPTI